MAFTIGSALAPILTELLDPVTRFVVGALKWVQQNKALVVTVAKVIVGVTALGVALMGIGTTISLAGAAIGGIATLITGTLVAIKAVAIGAFLAVKAVIVGTGVVLGALLSPIGLVVTAVVGLAAAFLYFTGLGAKALAWLGDTAGLALGWLSAQFTRLKQSDLTAWGGIADALAVGDIGLAAKILWLTLRMEWLRGIAWLTDRWLAFKNGMLAILDRNRSHPGQQ